MQVCVLVSVYTGYGVVLLCFGGVLKCFSMLAPPSVPVVGWDGALPVILAASKVHKV